MGFGKYLQIRARHWLGCHGNQQCWDIATRPSEEGSPWSSGGIFGLEISLYCYSANACQGAENISELKAFLPLLSCCFRKSIYPVLGSSSLLSAAEQEQGRERQGHQHRTQLAMFYRFPLPASSNYSKKLFSTNGAHGVSIVKICLLKSCFHKRLSCRGSNF